MLVLSRKKHEWIDIGDNVEVMVVAIRGDKVRLGFNAPREVTIHRREVTLAMLNGTSSLDESPSGLLPAHAH